MLGIAVAVTGRAAEPAGAGLWPQGEQAASRPASESAMMRLRTGTVLLLWLICDDTLFCMKKKVREERHALRPLAGVRSEERRVGKEGGVRGGPDRSRRKK